LTKPDVSHRAFITKTHILLNGLSAAGWSRGELCLLDELFDMPEIDAAKAHKPVMLDESMRILRPEHGGLFIDATLGLGGHSEAMLEASEDVGVIGIDRDAEALKLARTRLKRFGKRIRFIHANFSDIAAAVGRRRPNGIIADLGVSSLQFDSETRGFSFRFDAPLDMRMDPDSGGETAAELLARARQDELANIIYEYGEERASRKIARWIIEKREAGEPIETTEQLADLVRRAVRQGAKDKIHPATRTFQALRIAVNGELDILDRFIADSVDLLKPDGVLAVITFHSLEDRIVKRAFLRLSGRCQCPPRQPQCTCGAVNKVEILTRKPIQPAASEQKENPRSRSAKLRACRKVADNSIVRRTL
jgi:16S rRNA (cytosine1402-N4)-methyltransferase